MRNWMRFFLAAAVLAVVGACSNPAGPRYPEEEDPGPPPEGETQGYVLTQEVTFWV